MLKSLAVVLVVAVVAVVTVGCGTTCPKCPPKEFVEVIKPVPVPCPAAPMTALPDLPIFHLTPTDPPDVVAKAYHETAVMLIGEVLKLNALLVPYRPPNALPNPPDATP